MKARAVAAVLAILCEIVAAQTWSTPIPMCFEFNSPTSFAGTITFECGVTSLTVHFTSPVSTTIDQLELFVPFFLHIQADLHGTPALGGPLSAVPIASYHVLYWPNGYSGPNGPYAVKSSLAPATVTAGATYALVLRSMPVAGQCGTQCWPIYYDPAGVAPLPYVLVDGTACPNAVPAAGQLPFALRFRGFACGPGPLAGVGMFGSQCGNTGVGTAAYLGSVTPPVLGQPFIATLTGPYFETAVLFWSVGVNAIGTPIPGSPCQHFLDSQSVQTLALLGLEPLGSMVIPSPYAMATFTIPGTPSLAGAVLGAQAVVVGPSGTIPLGPGTFGQITNALQLTLGY